MGNSGEPEFFKNDGSFLERFKQLQQEQEAAKSPFKTDSSDLTSTSGTHQTSSSAKAALGTSTSKGAVQKPSVKTNGKLAFSLKQKSRLPVNALRLGGDEDEEGEDKQTDIDRHYKKQRLEKGPGSGPEQANPAPPTDPEIKKVADKLASFVAKNGRQFENITRQKNPGDTPFKFLFDVSSSDYKYYEYRIAQEEMSIGGQDLQQSQAGVISTSLRQSGNQTKAGSQHRTNYQTPASALYSSSDDRRRQSRDQSQESSSYSSMTSDSVAMMEFYMKKAAQEDLRKPPKQSKDEMPPPPSLLPPEKSTRHSPVMWASDEPPAECGPLYLSPTKTTEDISQAPAKKGHHMGDYIPPEELEKFLAKCNDAMAQKAAKATADRAKIQADNVGHRLLSKMGWKEGEGLGSRKGGRADPVQAGAVKLNNLGVGAEQPGEVTPDDDIYEQYKKKMMLGYRFRPNPLNNPRKAYY